MDKNSDEFYLFEWYLKVGKDFKIVGVCSCDSECSLFIINIVFV